MLANTLIDIIETLLERRRSRPAPALAALSVKTVELRPTPHTRRAAAGGD